MSDTNRIKIGRHTVDLSHVTKILFAPSRITKAAMIDYYVAIAPYFLKYSKNHLLVMQRFPNGITQEGFYQKQVPDYFPSWIARETIRLKKGENQSLIVATKSADLAYLANQGVITFHAWLSSIKKINHPDKIVFDLDPSRNDIRHLRFAARECKKVLESYGLVPFIMTTGSRGYHIVIPIVPRYSFEKVHEFARHVAAQLAHDYPDVCTIEVSKNKRKGRVFVDYLRNSYGQTSVAPYSLRAKKGAPVATPISWQELARTKPQQYTIKNIFRRLAAKEDPWKTFFKSAKKLPVMANRS